jgi:hypothetical protein
VIINTSLGFTDTSVVVPQDTVLVNHRTDFSH